MAEEHKSRPRTRSRRTLNLMNILERRIFFFFFIKTSSGLTFSQGLNRAWPSFPKTGTQAGALNGHTKEPLRSHRYPSDFRQNRYADTGAYPRTVPSPADLPAAKVRM